MNPYQIVINIRAYQAQVGLNQCPAITQSSHSGGVAPGNQTTRLLLIFFLGFACVFTTGPEKIGRRHGNRCSHGWGQEGGGDNGSVPVLQWIICFEIKSQRRFWFSL